VVKVNGYSAQTVQATEGCGMRKPAKFKFISPDNKVYEGENIRRFAKKHRLCPANLQHVHLGERNHHKGWRLAE